MSVTDITFKKTRHFVTVNECALANAQGVVPIRENIFTP